MNEKVVHEVLTRLDGIGGKIVSGGIKLGEEAIKWTLFNSIGLLIVEVLVLIVGTYWFVKLWNWALKTMEGKDQYDNLNGYFVLTMVSIGFCIMVIYIVCDIPNTIANIASPSWAIVRSFIPAVVN